MNFSRKIETSIQLAHELSKLSIASRGGDTCFAGVIGSFPCQCKICTGLRDEFMDRIVEIGQWDKKKINLVWNIVRKMHKNNPEIAEGFYLNYVYNYEKEGKDLAELYAIVSYRTRWEKIYDFIRFNILGIDAQ